MAPDPKIKKRLGLVQVYTGNGKGKTTACLGLAFRASGRGLNVLMLQFLKPAKGYGEHMAAEMIPNFTIVPMGADHMCGEEVSREEDMELTRIGMEKAEEALVSGEYDLVILDEINNTMSFGLATPKDVIALLERRAPNTEVVLSGRGVPQEIIDYADLVTEMRLVKHPFDKGIGARKGIEY
ncbi:MAG: cob(I)yrinic acid a,c-diamide adenosyltransferase [Candidatus Methanomethylophilaceae archaeon]|nr:cob(I)yrinic acid a,c-diamide adenosyltransferase [Candidatus Methanomethylophilaceae archaeon]